MLHALQKFVNRTLSYFRLVTSFFKTIHQKVKHISQLKSMATNKAYSIGVYNYSFSQIFLFLLFIRFIQALIVYLTPFQFDTSTSILIDRYADINNYHYPEFLIQILNKLMSWDSVYFLKLSLEGITYEHEWVFGPLWWRFMNFIIRYVKMTTDIDMGLYEVLMTFIIINNILLLMTSKILYILTMKICNSNLNKLPDNFNISKCAYYASFSLIIQPSGIFSTVAYSETATQFLSYLALYFYFSSRTRVNIQKKISYFISGSLFSLAFGVRSNALLYGLIFLYDLTQFTNLKDIIIVLLTGSQLFIALVFSNYIPYKIYCPERGEWCNSMTKSLVSYAQAHYWNNGFLNYFTVGNIPLFIIAMPQFVIMGKSIWCFRNWTTMRPVILVTAVYLFVQFTYLHVQIVNRVSTFLPIHLWYVSYLLTISDKWGKIISKWWLIWVFVQTELFAAFLPPA